MTEQAATFKTVGYFVCLFFCFVFYDRDNIYILAFDLKPIDDRIVSVFSHTYYIKQKNTLPNPYVCNRMSKKYFRLTQLWQIV